MTEEEIIQVVGSRFLNNFTGQFSTSIPNTPFTEPENETWVDLRINFNNATSSTLGAPGTRKNEGLGMILVDVHTPINTGTDENNRICRESRDLFDGQRLNDSWYFNGGITTIGRSDEYFTQRVTIEFNYEYTN